MLQDRRPNPPSPSSRSGANSPLPRRSANLAPLPLPPRPGLNPRSSSLSLASTPSGSVTNLASAVRNPNTSSLRHELRADVPQHSIDPLKTLEHILGTPVHVSPKQDGNVEALKGLEEPIDFQGLSLEEFVAQSSNEKQRSGVNSTSIKPEQCMCIHLKVSRLQ